MVNNINQETRSYTLMFYSQSQPFSDLWSLFNISCCSSHYVFTKRDVPGVRLKKKKLSTAMPHILSCVNSRKFMKFIKV